GYQLRPSPEFDRRAAGRGTPPGWCCRHCSLLAATNMKYGKLQPYIRLGIRSHSGIIHRHYSKCATQPRVPTTYGPSPNTAICGYTSDQ
ncbi:hypothetical protein Hamer_G016784, partial [Homarus americanus]